MRQHLSPSPLKGTSASLPALSQTQSAASHDPAFRILYVFRLLSLSRVVPGHTSDGPPQLPFQFIHNDAVLCPAFPCCHVVKQDSAQGFLSVRRFLGHN